MRTAPIQQSQFSAMAVDDAFFGIAVTLADAAAGRFASDAEISAALASPVTPGTVMADVFAALGMPLPAWADPEPPAHPRAA